MKRCCLFILICILFLIFFTLPVLAGERKGTALENRTESLSQDELRQAKKILVGQLHAKAACLMDMENGRVLFGKNEEEELPMASTTKVMTLLVLLKYGTLSNTVTVSSYAASQPKVHLGMRVGDTFLFEDLCYSLMLESHNDSAVALCEHVGSLLLKRTVSKETTREESMENIRAFVEKMNEEARELSLDSTCYITVNGLDREEDGKIHHSTAKDLCTLMSYAVENKKFCEITKKSSHSFSELTGNGSYQVYNHNQLLVQRKDCISGKTGFTGNAGYCYVGAVEIGGKRFAASVLGCGWPPNKGYKWEDMKRLFSFGDENYEIRRVGMEPKRIFLPVLYGEKKKMPVLLKTKCENMLLSKGERVEIKCRIRKWIEAPFAQGRRAGKVVYLLGGKKIREYPVVGMEYVRRISYGYYFRGMVRGLFEI